MTNNELAEVDFHLGEPEWRGYVDGALRSVRDRLLFKGDLMNSEADAFDIILRMLEALDNGSAELTIQFA